MDPYPHLKSNKAFCGTSTELLKEVPVEIKDPDLLTKYKDLLQKGYAKRKPAVQTQGKTWYLPHHAVFRPAKQGNVRVVFDCYAKYRRSSLNDQLLQGPDFDHELASSDTISSRARCPMSDVEVMFHQVHVNPENCNTLRFLWWPDNDPRLEPK